MKLDDLDTSIIRFLLQDGRMPAAEIARKIGKVTDRAVQYRIEKLIDAGMVRILADIMPPKIGLHARADILIDVESGKIAQVTERLAAISEVSYVACNFGSHDISITIHARNNEHLFSLVANSINPIDGVVHSQTMIVPVLLKFPYQWQVPVMQANTGSNMPEPAVPFMPADPLEYKLERVDLLIINLLMQDGRMSARKIAKIIDCGSAQFVRERIKLLVKKEVFSIGAILMPEEFGYDVRADIFITAEVGQAMSVAQKVAQLPSVSRVACSIDNHVSVQVFENHHNEVFSLIIDVIHRIPGVKKTKTNIVAKLAKEFYECYLPEYYIADRLSQFNE